MSCRERGSSDHVLSRAGKTWGILARPGGASDRRRWRCCASLNHALALQNLDPSVDMAALYNHFLDFGEIYQCKVRGGLDAGHFFRCGPGANWSSLQVQSLRASISRLCACCHRHP